MAPLDTDYDNFASECVEELKILQEKFRRDYNLTWYESWFYDQETALLTLSTNERKTQFRYYQVGTFSEKSKIWQWAWNNPNTLDNVKEQSRLVRAFGEKSSFPKLTQGLFESDEVEAWEFTAIAARLAGGIGAYRPVNDEQLKIFLVLTEFVDAESAKRIEDNLIECNTHGRARFAFVCQHINLTTKVGFEEAFESAEGMELEEDEDFQAWCDECEVIRQQEDGWNEKSMEFANIKAVCEKCYFKMKEFNLGHK